MPYRFRLERVSETLSQTPREEEGLISQDPDWSQPPLQLPLMGAWFCKTFSPLLMPLLYGAALLLVRPGSKSGGEEPEEELDELLDLYPTSLFPTLTLALESRLFRQTVSTLDGASLNVGLEEVAFRPQEPGSVSAVAEQTSRLPFPDGSLAVYRLNNTIHQIPDREAVLIEAARVLRPGGTLQVTDNTRAWVESIWTIRLARTLGKHGLAARLLQDKLKSSGQHLAPGAGWWARNLNPEHWELESVRPFFSTTAMTIASVFESLNFKQGGTSPEWLSRRVVRNPGLRLIYRKMLTALTLRLIASDPDRTDSDGGTFLLVTARRRA